MGNPLEFYFEVLNIPQHSSTQDIRNAYKALVKKWHPDKHPPASKPAAEEKFKAISQAYEVLNDKEDSRAMFGACDEGNECQERTEKSSQRRDVDSLPKEVKNVNFGRSAGSLLNAKAGIRTMRSGNLVGKKLPPIEKKLVCTLEELLNGCDKEVKFFRRVIDKNGLIVQKEETRTIQVKPGWKKGTAITLEGMGDEKPGYKPADIVFTIKEKQHPTFKRVGNDLVLKVEVPLVNALTGWKFSFRLLGGEKKSCSFSDKIIYPGYEKIIKGQGMPLDQENITRGDLRIKFNIVFPTQLSEEKKSSIKEFLNDST